MTQTHQTSPLHKVRMIPMIPMDTEEEGALSHDAPSSPSSLTFYLTPTYDPTSTEMFESPIQSSGEWHDQKEAERDAGLTPIPEVSFTQCEICGIDIGIGYYEQEMYLYPVVNKKIRVSNDAILLYNHDWLEVCGSCAYRKQLPQKWGHALRMLHPGLWETTILLNGRADPISTHQRPEAIVAIEPYVTSLYQMILFVSVWKTGASLRSAFVKPLKPIAIKFAQQSKKVSPYTSPIISGNTTQPANRFSMSKIGFNRAPMKPKPVHTYAAAASAAG